jgi:hypothetical protein
MGGKMLPIPRRRWLERENKNVHSQIMCGGDIERLLNAIYHEISMFTISLLSLINFINITLIKMM